MESCGTETVLVCGDEEGGRPPRYIGGCRFTNWDVDELSIDDGSRFNGPEGPGFEAIGLLVYRKRRRGNAC
jgi:hypothetical protein